MSQLLIGVILAIGLVIGGVLRAYGMSLQWIFITVCGYFALLAIIIANV